MNELIEVPKRSLTASDVREHVNLIQQVMKSVMIKDTHYGVIPGCDKPSLYKAGSEVLLTTFRISVDPEIIDKSTDDEISYEIKVRGIHQATGIIVGVGIGSCSSSEEKYKWRSAVCDEEWEETPESRRRVKWSKAWNDKTRKKDIVKKVKQVRAEIADQRNTVLKMAKKRAQIDMTLTATGASDIFTQDIEDLPEEIRESQQESLRTDPELQVKWIFQANAAPDEKALSAIWSNGVKVLQGANDIVAYKAFKDAVAVKGKLLKDAAAKIAEEMKTEGEQQ